LTQLPQLAAGAVAVETAMEMEKSAVQAVVAVQQVEAVELELRIKVELVDKVGRIAQTTLVVAVGEALLLALIPQHLFLEMVELVK
jgi:hypothetical protein